jgi:colanic acid biosynthesis protein WcaH
MSHVLSANLAALLSQPYASPRDRAMLPRCRENPTDAAAPEIPMNQSPRLSIDLIVTTARNEVLVGLKNERPAQDSWFVPGGELEKGERISRAFARIARTELNLDIAISEAAFLGVYEHLYAEDFSDEVGTGDHLVTLAYRVVRDLPPTHRLPRLRHRDYRWMSPAALLASPQVHGYVKKYFCPDAAVAR